MADEAAGLGYVVCRGIRVLADRILVRRDRPADVSKGGIVLPENSQDQPDEGTVVAVGPGRFDSLRTIKHPDGDYANYPGDDDDGDGDGDDDRVPVITIVVTVPMTVRAGDKVIFAKSSGTSVRHAGEDLVVLREGDVVAIVEAEAPGEEGDA